MNAKCSEYLQLNRSKVLNSISSDQRDVLNKAKADKFKLNKIEEKFQKAALNISNLVDQYSSLIFKDDNPASTDTCVAVGSDILTTHPLNEHDVDVIAKDDGCSVEMPEPIDRDYFAKDDDCYVEIPELKKDSVIQDNENVISDLVQNYSQSPTVTPSRNLTCAVITPENNSAFNPNNTKGIVNNISKTTVFLIILYLTTA